MNNQLEVESPSLFSTGLRYSEEYRPALGWTALLLTMMIALLPVITLRTVRWAQLGGMQPLLELVGPVAVLFTWWFEGWQAGNPPMRRWFGWIRATVIYALCGLFFISQLFLSWLPGPIDWVHAIQQNSVAVLFEPVIINWDRYISRLLLWWNGIAAGGAAQDNLVFASMVALLLWLFGCITALLVRRVQRGLLASVLPLWLIGIILLYSNTGRWLLIFAVGVAILLHLWLDQQVLQKRWQRMRLDYNPGVFVDRLLGAATAIMLVLTIAAVFPNLYISPVVERYYAFTAPMNSALEKFGERLFPELRATSRWRGSGAGGGLPNEFLLGGGAELRDIEILRFRTDEPVTYYDMPYEASPPPGHYMRSGTYALYDGLSWSNPSIWQRSDLEAAESLAATQLTGRKLVVQSVMLDVNSPVLYAAPEPIETSVDARIDVRAPDDIVALWARERSYTVVSAVPAVTEEQLANVASWNEVQPLPESMNVHLQLPESVSERTVQLSRELTAESESLYGKASTLERYLRQYEYDLDVGDPPADVTDIADYFLFDLQRGYCDYYATAFIVMARSVGIPARLATGFATGRWLPEENVWLVTEAEAHSWPEVYFPDYGWIAFEPTAGRTTLARIGGGYSSTLSSTGGAVPAHVAPERVVESEQNWQVWVWVLPILLGLWGLWLLFRVVMRRSEDPWLALLGWGRRWGRPIGEGETALEYGRGLSNVVLHGAITSSEVQRTVAREIEDLSRHVSRRHYAPLDQKEGSEKDIATHWQRLREYLPQVRLDAGKKGRLR
jgi:transglutaminase-like putative cysteine protease